MEEAKVVGKYSASDRLAIVLACLAGVMAIFLFLVEKTPATVIVLLVVMVGLSIYPIIHFAKSRIVRAGLVLFVIAGATLFGWRKLSARADGLAAMGSQQQEPPAQQNVPKTASSPKPSVQQSNKGNNDTNINGNGNTVTNTTIVIKQDDPRAKELEKQLSQLMAQQKALTPRQLLSKYPLGYVIFDLTYQNSVFPYKEEGEVAKWHIDWSTYKYSRNGDMIKIQIPDFKYRNGVSGLDFSDNTVTCSRRVGGLCGGGVLGQNGNVQMLGEILKVNSDGTVLLFGFRHAP